MIPHHDFASYELMQLLFSIIFVLWHDNRSTLGTEGTY